MSRPPLVSIVVSSFNYARYLPAALDSALAQTHPRVEVVVVDDGSTDSSRQIIAAYADRVTPVLKSNGGQGSALNAGFAACRGDIVIFLDSDDVLLPSAAASGAAAIGDDARAVKAHWPLAGIDAAGARTGRTFPNGELPEGDLLGLALREGPDGYPWPPTSGNAWTRRFLEAVLPIPEALFRTCPDIFLTAWAPFYGTIRRVREPQACWRVHGENHSWSAAFDDRLAGLVTKWDAMFAQLAAHCSARGLPANVDQWTQKSWFHRIQRAVTAIAAVVPPGEAFVVADGDEWETGEFVSGRRRFSFVERNGRYWGSPADDEQAIAELIRLRRCGGTFLAVGWPTFWWLDHYRGFRAWLERQARLAHTDEDLIVYDLRPVAVPEAAVQSICC